MILSYYKSVNQPLTLGGYIQHNLYVQELIINDIIVNYILGHNFSCLRYDVIVKRRTYVAFKHTSCLQIHLNLKL